MGPDHQVEISDSIELCIVELTRVDCISIHISEKVNIRTFYVYNILF